MELKELIFTEYNAIEARGVAWLAGARTLLDVLQRGEDPHLYQACHIHTVPPGCTATFYNRLPHGDMPAIVKIGRRTIITAEVDEEWRERMERTAGRNHTEIGEA